MEKTLLKEILQGDKRVMLKDDILEIEEAKPSPRRIKLDLCVLLDHEDIVMAMVNKASMKENAILKRRMEAEKKKRENYAKRGKKARAKRTD